MRRTLAPTLATLLAALAACGGGDPARPDVAADVPDAAGDLAADLPADLPDAAPDIPADTPADAPADALPPAPHADRVDPRIGTGGYGWFAGNVSVGAQAPFGMVQAGPDGLDDWNLPWNHCSGWHADDHHVTGFSHSHLHGTGIPDLGAVGFLPVAGGIDDAPPAAEGQSFDRASEAASPGYYALTLSDGVRVELTATEVAAVHRYSFAPGTAPGALTLRIDLSHTLVPGNVADGALAVDAAAKEARIRVVNVGEFTRYSGTVEHFLAVRWDRAPASWGTWKGTDRGAVAERQGPDTGAWLTWDASDGKPVEVRVGLSFVDLPGAAGNLADLPAGGFDAAFARTRAAWESALSKVRCRGGDDRLRTLYTALYHALMMPNRWQDLDGRYRGLDHAIHADPGFTYHSNFSLWDTYRGLHSLLVLLEPARQLDQVRSLVQMGKEGGYLPKWPLADHYTNVMIGSPADMVVAESYLKGLRDFDVATAWEKMTYIANHKPPEGHPYQGRNGVEDYVALGYVPFGRWSQSVSRTLEFAIADAALARLADALGKPDEAATYRQRSGNWRNLWDPSQGWFAPRNADGTFEALSDPLDTSGLAMNPYTEGNALQYLWLVPQDPAGLVDLLGGPAATATRLEDFFQQGADENAAIFAEEHDPLWWMTSHPKHYWHGNEPDQHAAYLFHDAGRPDLARKWLRWVQDTLYTNAPDGLPGNDDAGTLSSWYAFNALGFFPMPGDDRYWLGTPLFERCEVDLPGGKSLVVEAPGAAASPQWAAATWNGVPVEGAVLRHADLAAGGTLRFE